MLWLQGKEMKDIVDKIEKSNFVSKETIQSIVHQILKAVYDLNKNKLEPLSVGKMNKLINKNLDQCAKHNKLNSSKDWQDVKDRLAQIYNQETLDFLSRKLAKKIKDEKELEWTVKTMAMRSRILDHFSLAYLMGEKIHPSKLKLVQFTNPDGGLELYFDKKSSIEIVK
jgi:hypothetical protein